MLQKRFLSDLAAYGGAPAFGEPLHVGRPNIGDPERFLALASDILGRRWLTNNGPMVQEFEAKIRQLLGARNCVAVCNGTASLEIAIRGLGLAGEVIVPSYTFVATAHALQWQEITPVFCDIDPATHCLDPRRVEELITPRTTGILGVHLWGTPCDVTGLASIAKRHGLRLLFDASHALGATVGGVHVGNFGDAEVFSFHATKFVNAFEGGAIVTNDDDLAAKLRLMRNFGFAGYDNVIYLGTNGKMSEISAAMGLVNLESIDAFVRANKTNYARYAEQLAAIPGVELRPQSDTEARNFQYVVVEVNEDRLGMSRDDLLAVLQAERVLARRYFWPGCHRMEPYRTLFPNVADRLPATARVADAVIVLPTGTAIGAAEIEVVGSILRVAAANAGDIAERRRREAVEIAR